MYDKYRDAYAQRNAFLQIWGDIDKIKSMSLEDYTDIKNANNFTYWIETRTQACGTIKGTWATKAGIYGKASDRKLSKRQYFDDGKYAWYRSLGEERAEAFKIVREKISESLERYLTKKNKDSKIFRETQYIDMVLITLDKKTYYEIKTHSKVIYCLREAIGQILQYCYYQKADTYPFADELIIIGEPIPNEYDIKYLQILRKKYNLNLFYQYFDPEKMFLSNKY